METMYFSVNRAYKIGNKRYIPSVCYEMKEEIREVIEKLKAEGKANIYKKYTYFVNGKVLEKKAPKAVLLKKVETPTNDK